MKGYSRRRHRLVIPVRLIAAVLVAAVTLLAVVQTIRAFQMDTQIQILSHQVETLTQQKEALEAKIPAVVVANDSFAYQSKYPDMVVKDVPARSLDAEKTVYLTFDDGPSKNTPVILDTLKAQGAHATFFIIGKNVKGNESLLKRMVEEGHTVAIHTYSHDYKAIYTSVDAYLDDFYQAYTAVYEACGVYPSMFRFPGGSINGYNGGLYQPLIAEMTRRGFVYYDWSVSSEDATGKKLKAEQLTQNVVQGVASSKHPVVLMHDAAEKTTTAQAVPGMLQQLKAAGYECKALTNDVRPITFGYHE